MAKILVTGAYGQLGSELSHLSSVINTHSITFFDREDLDITDENAVWDFLVRGKFEFVINCAAYTAVDKAESDKETAFKVNATGAGNLAKGSREINAKFIHISTDFIFDGTISRPLLEDDKPNPISVYGASKLEGEKLVLAHNPETILIRTSWVYSSYGSNFVKTILRLCKERDSLNVIYDQVGSPTYARDLASAIIAILAQDWKPGVYHFGNEGVASWYDFAIAICDLAGLNTVINPIETSEYLTPAARPHYSVLNKRKIKETFGLTIPHWHDSLVQCMKLLK
jgi:dTDP-4-dehydrorhamnose reductase